MAFGAGLGQTVSTFMTRLLQQQPQPLSASRDSHTASLMTAPSPSDRGTNGCIISPHLSPSHLLHPPTAQPARACNELPASLGSWAPLISPARLIIGDLWSLQSFNKPGCYGNQRQTSISIVLILKKINK